MKVKEVMEEKPTETKPLSTLGIGLEIMLWDDEIPLPYQTIIEQGDSLKQAYG